MKNQTLHQGTLDRPTQATCHHHRIIQDFLVILMDFLCKPTCVRLVNTVKLFIKIIAPASHHVNRELLGAVLFKTIPREESIIIIDLYYYNIVLKYCIRKARK